MVLNDLTVLLLVSSNEIHSNVNWRLLTSECMESLFQLDSNIALTWPSHLHYDVPNPQTFNHLTGGLPSAHQSYGKC